MPDFRLHLEHIFSFVQRHEPTRLQYLFKDVDTPLITPMEQPVVFITHDDRLPDSEDPPGPPWGTRSSEQELRLL